MSVASSQSNSTPRPNDPLFKVKLLAALRSGDPATIVPLIAEFNKGSRSSVDGSANEAGSAALHLAIRCASCDTIRLLLQQRPISPNAVESQETGTTALHLAASIGRADVVSLLLEQEDIDDTIRDSKGRTCKEVAKTKEVARIIQDSRAVFAASYTSLLRTYILSPSTASVPDALLKLLQSPRIRNVDLNQLDAASGSSILHEAVKRKDLRLIEIAVRAGADVFVRDRRGRGVTDYAGKDDRIKTYLRQFANQDTTLLDLPASQAQQEPTMRGYLTKYGNLAKGYNTRWFVLKDGMLSYYRHQDDEDLACRGSLSMRNARIKASSTDKLRFEIHASTRNGEGIPEKWYMKANHAVEVARWVQTLQRAIEWSRKSKGVESDTGSIKSNKTGIETVRSTESAPARKRFSRASGSGVFSSVRRRKSGKTGSPSSSVHDLRAPSVRVDNDSSDEDVTANANVSEDQPPHQENFALLGNTAATHLDLAMQLLSTVAVASNDANNDAQISTRASLTQAQDMYNEYAKMVGEREAWFRAKITRERERATIWEESLHKVVQEGEELEEELKKTIRLNKQQRRRSRGLSDIDIEATIRQRAIEHSPPPPHSDTILVPVLSPVPEATPTIKVDTPAATSPGFIAPAPPTAGLEHVDQLSPVPRRMSTISRRRLSIQSEDSDSDEFFDAIEANTLPNMIIPESLKAETPAPVKNDWNVEDFAGYMHIRERLDLDADNRPPVSLWAVLKGSIGKDLTRISFPVFFNEPTSMLQRMAEDMEFTECLDAAASEQDPYRRIAFVAAFAMSNYSSTIGRIAKPFNPCLSETFEYVRPDRRYKYVSEQVSHHPPISACWADSPGWQYYGEVDAKNKFAGKSFTITPTGLANVNLKLPQEWVRGYPKASSSDPGKVLEHYSWKKVTTNVSGFIVGNPTIDHYGEMRVVNHRTMDQCILTFKPRGWKAKDSFEIKGEVLNAKGEVEYEIAGRWNSQLVMRKAGNHATDLLPDVSVSSPSHLSMDPHHEYILLWRNTVKPQAPFNLTPFAITLNDCPDKLKPYLPPTDCRLRPDQRAFELGRYERANELKSEQEDFQRATRRKREQGQIPPHRPRWFVASTEPDTGDRYWAPIMQGDKLEYWFQRELAVQAVKAGTPFEWPDVDPIFIEADF